MDNILTYEIGTKIVFKIFFCIVSFENLNFGLKLGLNHDVKTLKYVTNFRLFMDEENSSKACVIINERHKPMIT